jgi:Pyruvate/2-oxoacid:ferredoxin oxidoreductase gamma subunit
MFAVRFHGRGGQGVVTAAELLAAIGDRFTGQVAAGNTAAAVAAFDYVLAECRELTA